MYKINLPYGNEVISADIPGKFECSYLKPREVDGVKNPYQEIHRALNHPEGDMNTKKLCSAHRIAIAINDMTRPVPVKLMLNALLDWLIDKKVPVNNLTIFIGNGLHRKATAEELQAMLPQKIMEQGTVINHDAFNDDELAEVGVTSRGTPVKVNRYFLESDFRIVLGMIEPHQFAGFTGGAKGVAIGLGGKDTISENHKKLVEGKASPGCLEGNPVRREIDEIGAIIGVDLILNVVLNLKKEIIKAVAGHYYTAHREGSKLSDYISRVSIGEPADLVIASPGGAPKDANFYQAQKALYHAEKVVKEGGTILLVSRLEEGAGDEVFKEKMEQYNTPAEVIDDFIQKPFKIRAHKAYLWCRTLIKARTIIVSSHLDGDLSRLMKIEQVKSLQEAIDLVLEKLPVSAKIAVMPNALALVPG